MLNAIVTGGSRGLGLGIARRLAATGMRVLVVARTENEGLLEAASQARDAGFGALEFVPFDLSEIESIPDLVKGLRRQFGPIYGLVNNAGMSVEGVLATTSTEQIERVIRLNTTSPLVLTKQVVRLMMVDGGGGRIVNMSSVVASTGYSGLAVYAATKASLAGFTRSLAREVGRLGVTVNAVAPGFVVTAMTASISREQRETIERRSPLRRLAEVEDVASAVEFLFSPGAKNITGTVITVDAGNTA